ncbi:uncharacterized protein DUF4397 [Natranaerovirga pectinivora]|uniref:Uncharacterized protein DUF4397 n=1 Tax=Natranaerovirga pectinivora TaxID=682400 RepID=A0A4R3MK31_9FIRM|nr:DUF4397 domain-containing protein [Natranaerovirga pectinivora]TCT12125.1 uncharacterized protein DUF4397 [Natranaerovirga pectinivora]
MTKKNNMDNTISNINVPIAIYPPSELLVKPTSRSNSYIRIGHFSPDAPPVDAYIDDYLLASNLSFGQETFYKIIEPDSHNIKLYPTGEKNSPLIDETIKIPKGTVVSTIAINRLDKLDIILVNDNVYVSPGEIMIKFSNMSPNGRSMNFYINDALIFENVTYRDVTYYTDLSINTYYNILVTDYVTGEAIIDVPNLILLPTSAYSFYGVGLQDNYRLVITLDGSSYFFD